MRVTSKYLVVFLFLNFFLTDSKAETGVHEDSIQPSVVNAPGDEVEWVKIRALKKLYEDAIQKNDILSLAPYISEQFTGTMLTGEDINGIDGLTGYNSKIRDLIGEGATYQLLVEYEPGWLFGDTALAHGITKEIVVTSKNNRFEYQSHWTALVRNENGVWKLFRLHVSIDPVNNPFSQFFYWHKYRLLIIAAFVIGSIISMFIGKYICSRKS